MSVNSYYRDELSYLKELGVEFAKANPRLSKYLADDPTDRMSNGSWKALRFSSDGCVSGWMPKCRKWRIRCSS
jgi:hypothetical protein